MVRIKILKRSDCERDLQNSMAENGKSPSLNSTTTTSTTTATTSNNTATTITTTTNNGNSSNAAACPINATDNNNLTSPCSSSPSSSSTPDTTTTNDSSSIASDAPLTTTMSPGEKGVEQQQQLLPGVEENGHLSSSDDAAPMRNGLGSDVSSLASSPSTPPQSTLPSSSNHPQATRVGSPGRGGSRGRAGGGGSNCNNSSCSNNNPRASPSSGSVSYGGGGGVGGGVDAAGNASGTTTGGGGGGPQQQVPAGGAGSNSQHVVHVHVNPGETFSVRLGDQIQHIQGPATVRMVSSNGPPVPMPMQVPPGHMVQQIVDENGILTHVILSPQPPMPAAAPMTGGPSNAQQYYPAPYGPHYASAPQYPSHHHPHPHPAPHNVHPHMHSGMPHIQSPPPHTCTNHAPVHPSGASPPLNSSDERTLRQRNRVRKKIQQRRPPEGYYPQPGRNPGRRRGGGVNGEIHHGNGGHGNSHMVVDNGPVEPEEDNSLIIQYLSNIPKPKVTDVEARSALIQLSPPECDAPELDLDLQECKYELLLSDKERDSKYKTVFCGDATEITLKDLRPALEYHLKVLALLSNDLKGALTEPVSFWTLPCEPDRPQPPKLMNKTKLSIMLKWNATCENGSKISTYSLEYDQGQGDNFFVEIYNGLNRQFRVVRLNASTRYLFRLAAINGIGKSQWSEVASFYTSGSVPSQPDPPMLSEQFVKGLTISWIKRPNEDEFLLQMEDEATGHGFMPVYNGPNLSYSLKHLRRNTEYKFRLAAKNDEGLSKWSDPVTVRTLPDKPAPPCKPQIKGKVLSHAFRVTWEPPADDGGAEITKYIVELDDGQGYETVYEGSDREHQFEQLTPGHQYWVRVACCNQAGRSEFSDCCLATTQPVAPGQCQAPKLQGKPKATSLHLRWSYPDYDGGSQVTQFAAQMISPDNSTREVYKGQDLDCIVLGLLPGRPYLFQVRAFNRAGAGPWSELLEVVSGAGAPDPPRSPQLTCRSPHSALVMWDQPFHNGATISEYRLEWTQTPDTHDFSQLYVGPNLSYEAKGLTPATTYTFRVQAVNAAGTGLYSPPASCQTPPSSPGTVVSLRWQASPTTAQLWWRPPPCNGSDLLSYNISISDKQVIAVEPVSEYTLENLQPETTYKIRIQAVNGIGVGPYSAATKVTTRALPPSPPRLECLSAAPNSLKLKWGDGRNPDLVRFTLEMEKEDGSFQAVYSGPAHTHKVNRLTEMSSYEFRIFASNDAGHGPYSDTVTFTTTKAPPPALKAARVHEIGQHHCEVEWQGCRSPSSDPITYILQLQRPHTADHEYRQAYRGSQTRYFLQSLEPGTDYQVRVCAVRESGDGSAADIHSPFSPGTHFVTASPEPVQRATPAREVETRTSLLAEPRQWTDQQKAAVILLGFVVLAVLVAIVIHQVLAYMAQPPVSSSPSSATAATSSSTSSSQHHHHHHHHGKTN